MTRAMSRTLRALLFLAWLAPAPARADGVVADAVVPSAAVRSRVVVRERPEAGSRDVGSLRPRERAEYVGAAPGWRRVRLGDGTTGFVSEAFTEVEVRAANAAPEPPPEPSAWRRFGAALGIAREPRSAVEIDVRDPNLEGGLYRHLDPDLPVAGFAYLAGASLRHDVVVALDVSSSTTEHAGADVDGDGRRDEGWKGPDSIHRAQLAAARRLLARIERMPHNRGGERIRIALVTYSGDERLRRLPGDEKRRPSDAEILRLAARDADVPLPLTGDYAEARRALDRLERLQPIGMTDVAAGVGRALIELQATADRGAPSSARPDARKTILLLTDGKPSLPFDRKQADAAASWAGRMAAEAGVVVNAFAIGHDAVSRSGNGALERMAERSGGRYVELARPGDVVPALESTSLTSVERIELANRTTGRGSDTVATGIDGSFYGEVRLAEGVNEIEVTAVLSDGSRGARHLRVVYEHGRPIRELALELERIQRENEALVERIRTKLALEVQAARRHQRKALEVEVRTPVPAAPAR
jgi:hypothetical protein